MDVPAPFPTVLREMSSEELFALEEQVRDLLEHPAWNRLSELVGLGKAVVHQQIAHGKTHGRAQYARYAGFLSGADAWDDCAKDVMTAAASRREHLEAEAERERTDDAAQEETERSWAESSA
jgi:hypothetical protein